MDQQIVVPRRYYHEHVPACGPGFAFWMYLSLALTFMMLARNCWLKARRNRGSLTDLMWWYARNEIARLLFI